MNDFDCLGFGICAADYLCLTSRYPVLDEKTETVDFSYQGGGPVATALVTLARLGFRGSFIGKVGVDADGRFVRQQLLSEGVDTTGMIVDEQMSTNQAFIWIDQASGKKAIVLNNKNYRPARFADIFLTFVNSLKYLHIDGRDETTALELIEWARSKNAKIVLDAGSPRKQIELMLKRVDYPVVSQTFCHSFLGTNNYEAAVKKLLAYGARAAVITCGEQGCFGAAEDRVYHQPAFPVEIVDTTGAGDVFHGAFIAGLLKKWNLPKILRFASACAAIKCTQLGGRKGIPNFSQVTEFLHKYQR